MSWDPIGLICRHGSTVLNEQDCFRGRMDPPLDDDGIAQARTMASFLGNLPISRIYSSPLLRAYQTASVISDAIGVSPIIQDRELFPWNVGFLSGKPKDAYSSVLEHFIENPSLPVPEGESLDDFERKTFDFFDLRLSECKPDSMSAFVCHTSNATMLTNIILASRDTSPELGEVVRPGGICGIFTDGKSYHIEPVYGTAEEENFLS